MAHPAVLTICLQNFQASCDDFGQGEAEAFQSSAGRCCRRKIRMEGEMHVPSGDETEALQHPRGVFEEVSIGDDETVWARGRSVA